MKQTVFQNVYGCCMVMDTNGIPKRVFCLIRAQYKYRHLSFPYCVLAMALSISVHPLTPTLDMYGEPDSRYGLLALELKFLIHAFSSAAYSLSGHVSISVASSQSLFNHRSTVRLLLQSLSLTFEGQSEVYAPCIGYSSLRLCSVTRELFAPSKPTELSNGDSGETCMLLIHPKFKINLSGH